MPNKSQTVPGHIAPPLKPNYRTYSGRFPSRKAKRAIFYTSVLENDALLLLETDPAIDDLGPYEDIAWLGRGREESFLRLWFRRGETKTLLGVGHAETFAEITDWIKAMRSKAIKRGYRLETWTETDIRVGRQVENARRIFYESSRVLDPDPDLHESKLRRAVAITQSPISIGGLLQKLDIDPDRLDIAFCIMELCRLGLELPQEKLSLESMVRRSP